MANIKTFNGGIRAMWQKHGRQIVSIGLMTIVFGTGGWVTRVELGLASNSDRIERSEETLAKAIQTQIEIRGLMSEANGQLGIILQLLGIKIQDSTIARWKNMPRSLPLDSLGKPIRNSSWLDVTDGYLLGTIYKWVNADSILTKVAWDERPKERANDEP